MFFKLYERYQIAQITTYMAFTSEYFLKSKDIGGALCGAFLHRQVIHSV